MFNHTHNTTTYCSSLESMDTTSSAAGIATTDFDTHDPQLFEHVELPGHGVFPPIAWDDFV